MKKNHTTPVIGFGIMLLFVIACFVPGTGGLQHQNQPDRLQIELTMKDDTTMLLSLRIPQVQYSTIDTVKGSFAQLTLPDEGVTTTIGTAQLPMIRRMIEIPYGATPQLTVESTSWVTTSLAEQQQPSRIIPVQPPNPKTSEQRVGQLFVINDQFYSSTVATSSDIARIADAGEIRGHRFIMIEVSPVQYTPSTGKLQILTSCQLSISLPGSDFSRTADIQARYASPAFSDLLQNTLLNYGGFVQQREDPKTPIGYLIIVYDTFYEEIQPLATWKQSLGFTVTVTRTSQIPGGATATNIRTYITTAYNQWNPPPSYVLLVGDTGQIPAWTGQSTGTCTDLNYAAIQGSDYFPDLIVSRFPAALESHVTNMVTKTIYYETGNFATTAWIKKAAFMASNDNYPVSEGTHNYVINTYLIPHGYTCDKLYCHTYGATTQQVRNALNNGRSLAIYSGHGDVTYWADGPVFYQSDVNGLTNTNMYPFVCSHACLTGQYSYGECFGETWLRAQNKAGLAFWGASDYTYWDEDDILERRMFSAWWDENLETIGGMTDRAKYLLYQYYGGGGMSRYYYEAYNVLGDSSVKIWSEAPSNIAVEGDCYYPNMSPANTVTVQVINLDTKRVWQATTDNNHYSLLLGGGRDINASETLRFVARDDSESVNVTDHVVTTGEISANQITQDLVLDVHYRDLSLFPYYTAEMDTGAAAAQMMLNYLWWNQNLNPEEPPLYYPDQSILFTAFNTNGGLYLNADELCTGLNLYKPLPVETYGYFFQTSASTDPNEVLEWICIWLDFTFGVPYFEGLPTNWPAPGHVANVPITVPLDGNYNHWVVVRGIHTDRDAWADYPDFPTITIKGFWINDPKTSNGLGSNTYVTADQFLSTYFKPIRIVGDSYINQYLALMDPPQDIQIDAQDTNVVVASTPAGFTTNQALVVAKTQTLIADKITVITAQNAVTNILKYDTTGLMQLFIDAQVQGRPSYVGDTICIIFRNLDVTFTVELSRTTGALRQFSVEGL